MSALLPASARRPGVAVAFVDGPIEIQAHSYGGDRLLVSGTFVCTSGFTVSDGTFWGVSTAGHCSGINQYKQNDGLIYTTSFQNQARGQWGDFEWHTTSHPEFPEFYTTPTTRRVVQAVKGSTQFFPGQLYCAFGRATNGNACAEVQFGNFDCGSQAGRQVIMSLDGQVGSLGHGDSGGPWYISNTAAGTFTGWCVISDGLAHLMFSKAANMFNAIGAAVVIGP